MVVFGKTDIGKVRAINQDTFACGELAPGIIWAVVCDGMGGAVAGDVASSTAVKVISNSIKNSFMPNMKVTSIKNMLTTAVYSANVHIYEMAKANRNYLGMGTTVVAAVVMNNTVFITHVGDSRAYLINKQNAFQLTRDHTFVQNLVERGHLTEDEAKNHPRKNIITRALGVAEKVDFDYMEMYMSEGDGVLICTDGMSNYFSADEIKDTITRVGFIDCVDEFINVANDLGGTDNITIVTIS